jgi:hypothetical protein
MGAGPFFLAILAIPLALLLSLGGSRALHGACVRWQSWQSCHFFFEEVKKVKMRKKEKKIRGAPKKGSAPSGALGEGSPKKK